jgi:hypothetical protein
MASGAFCRVTTDEFVKKMAQYVAQPVFVKIRTKLFPWKKVHRPTIWAASVIFHKTV